MVYVYSFGVEMCEQNIALSILTALFNTVKKFLNNCPTFLIVQLLKNVSQAMNNVTNIGNLLQKQRKMRSFPNTFPALKSFQFKLHVLPVTCKTLTIFSFPYLFGAISTHFDGCNRSSLRTSRKKGAVMQTNTTESSHRGSVCVTETFQNSKNRQQIHHAVI